MKRITSVIVFSLILIISKTFGQTWIRIYEDNCYNRGQRVYEHYDKGYIVTGQRYVGNTSLGWIFKTDINGNELWSKSYGTVGKSNGFHSSVQSLDGGMICFGFSHNLNESCGDPLLVKLNACGEKEWCKIYNSANCLSVGCDISSDPLGGNMLLISQWLNTVQPDVWLFKTDNTGDIEWTQQYVSDPNIFWSPFGRRLINTSDSCFVIMGHAWSPDSLWPGDLLSKLFLVKVNVNGTTLFQSPWGASNGVESDSYNRLEDADHTIYTVGRRSRENPPSGDSPCLFVTDSNGQALFYSDLINNSYLGCAYTVNWFQDSTLVSASAWQNSSGVDTSAVFKMSSTGSIIKKTTLFASCSCGFDVSNTTFNNRVLLVGGKEMPSGYVNAFAVKLNSDLDYDSVYTTPFTYDSLCPHPILSDTIPLDDCETVVVSVDDPVKHPEKTQLYVYPNPAKDILTVEMPRYLSKKSYSYGITATTYYHQWNSSTLEIFDLFGKLIYSKEIPKKTEKVELDVSSWHEGMYVARIVFMNEVVADTKFVVE